MFDKYVDFTLNNSIHIKNTDTLENSIIKAKRLCIHSCHDTTYKHFVTYTSLAALYVYAHIYTRIYTRACVRTRIYIVYCTL